MPMIQFSLVSMLELVDEGVFSLETVVQKCVMHLPGYTVFATVDISVKAIRRI